MVAEPDTPAHLALYEHELCGFCRHVRHAIDASGLEVESRNILREPGHREDLIAGGGRGMVPCLRIEHRDGQVDWLYESADIIAYLERLAAR
ncbi:glutaredoxin family protein [Spiribacter halobius]|uniref:Glutaredoxin n=1 Tax=Sediminicurvatus halobius TaxID=2182432 RepID=A0A2U2N233_9GAMM|nr:glutathione S-transferase N-terminal domain-containing protein [Spiribacter halobius]PWG63123.1 glutaredoxin [Spiribacter halobius]UEX77573.1 glutathione S-transferase domain-containing protein [Spiribacter halobius]